MSEALVRDSTKILSFLEQHLDEYLTDLRTLTAIDSGTLHKPGVDAVQSWLQARLQAMGFQVERIAQNRLGDNLLARRQGGGGKRILLLGHADTVFPIGTAAARPMRIDGNIIRGPGVCDMKGGLLAGLYAVRALDELGLCNYGALQFLIVSDEEIHDRGSIPLIRQAARTSDVAFTLEAARANGDIVTARKTAVWCTVRVQGRAAHAGVEPEKGRNAILALIRHLLEIDKLNGFRPGVTVNIGRIEGGTQPNVVAEEARAELDLRAWRNAEIPELLDAIHSQLARPVLEGTTATLDVNLDGAMPAMERTPAVAALEALAQRIAHDLGFTVKGASTGGASDASFVAAEGVPVLDGLGPIGGLDHSPEEYIELDSIVPRTALLALLIAEAGTM
ncbi:MAG: M20 family metallopeptidase [Caldilinea sp.]|nr:M20 family metallopeptidase [Caldilinea sp.]MDW8439802.1 M20 family metallopeptidase [Caldilineaceae bacterium]